MTTNDSAVLITGAAGGLGRHVADVLAQAGMTPILLDKRLPELEAVYDRIVARGGKKPWLYPFDLAGASEADYQELAERIEQNGLQLFGVLHAAAELGVLGPLATQAMAAWGHVFNVNLHAPFLLTRVLLPLLQRSTRQASVVFVSESQLRGGRAYCGAYGIAKTALESLALTWADELASAARVRVNVLRPGKLALPLRRRAFPVEDSSSLAPLHGLDALCRYLFSDESHGINGQFFLAPDLRPVPRDQLSFFNQTV